MQYQSEGYSRFNDSHLHSRKMVNVFERIQPSRLLTIPMLDNGKARNPPGTETVGQSLTGIERMGEETLQ